VAKLCGVPSFVSDELGCAAEKKVCGKLHYCSYFQSLVEPIVILKMSQTDFLIPALPTQTPNVTLVH
jgi:hypothetical protein